MQKFHPYEVDISTYYFGVHKIVGVSSRMVMFRVQVGRRNGVDTFHYFPPQRVLSNDLSSNPNGDSMQNLRP